MSEHKITAAPDYTNAAIAMFGVNLMWIFFAIWVIYGFVAVLVIAMLINYGISRIADRHAQRN